MRIFLLAFLVLFFTPASALTLEEAYQRLRDKPVDYTNQGAICEQVVALQVDDYFTDYHHVAVGITYRNSPHGQTVGELDVVVFKGASENREAVAVIEVKCSSRPGRQLRHAREQLRRFETSLKRNGRLILKSTTAPYEVYSSEIFIDPDYMAGSVVGSMASGYDLEIPFTKSEALALRRRLIACQNRGECPQAVGLFGKPKL